MGKASRQRWNHEQIPEMILVIDYHRFSYNVSAGFAAVDRHAWVIAFGPHRSRALTMFGELAETGHIHRYNPIRLHSTMGYVNRQTTRPGQQKELLANKTQSSTQFEKANFSQSISFNP